MLSLFLDPEGGIGKFCPNRRLAFNGQRGFKYQKVTLLFVFLIILGIILVSGTRGSVVG
jgi:hypothetical protein